MMLPAALLVSLHLGASVAWGDTATPFCQPSVEVQDGVDNDCDGDVDNGTPAFDDDGDGWTELGGDCDDSNATRHPAAVELPQGIDDNCNGTIDEHTEAYDDDGDGFSEEDGDCNDGSHLVHPNRPELADAGIDDSSDGIREGSGPDPA
ncbi:MAG: putative metal-binding motif-containing protein, partial [Myxococcota bacterium]